MEVRTITWNLFHGRDRAPDASLHTWRSRLLRATEKGQTHAQVNCDLFEQFAELLAAAEWDVALLQECPPRWAEGLATECRADPHLVLTSRNLPAPLDLPQRLAARLSPDLIASWEGGSNLTLVRGGSGYGPAIEERQQFELTDQPETRTMALTRLTGGLCVANLHASEAREAAELELRKAARAARVWAGNEPLILGGDLNLRPATSAALFDELERDEGLSGAIAADSVDHLLSRGLDVVEPPRAWPPERREVPDPTAGEGEPALPIRLSDHAPVEALFGADPGG